jgi:HNH endonuclease
MLDEGEYRTARGCGLIRWELSEIPESLDRFRDGNNRAMDRSARRPATASIRGAHSPGLVAYLAEVTGVRLVNPTYYASESSSEIARELDDVAADQALADRPEISQTMKEALRKYRCGQGIFRDRVRALEPRCRVTNIDSLCLLRASHIKPWRESDNRERLDGNNGLFLAPHIDSLFDQRLISFSDEGDLLLSPELDRRVLTAWAIPEVLNVRAFSAEQCQYLQHHRGTIEWINMAGENTDLSDFSRTSPIDGEGVSS